jgi:hypothetical protein
LIPRLCLPSRWPRVQIASPAPLPRALGHKQRRAIRTRDYDTTSVAFAELTARIGREKAAATAHRFFRRWRWWEISGDE